MILMVMNIKFNFYLVFAPAFAGAIHKTFAQIGHDRGVETAPDKVYDNLPSCCQYKR